MFSKTAKSREAGARVTAPGRGGFADELAAFANGRGGTVVLGIDDKAREVLGIAIEHIDAVESWVRELCNMTGTEVLLCIRAPQRWMSHAQIQAAGYAGDRRESKYQTDARDVGGPLDVQVMQALHFLRRNMLIQATKTLGRVEIPQFSERAVFEALVNAVAHRDYSMAGARVRLHMFGDRLELYVPGGLANTLTPDSVALRQYNRNELIVSLLARCPVGAEEESGGRI